MLLFTEYSEPIFFYSFQRSVGDCSLIIDTDIALYDEHEVKHVLMGTARMFGALVTDLT